MLVLDKKTRRSPSGRGEIRSELGRKTSLLPQRLTLADCGPGILGRHAEPEGVLARPGNSGIS